MVSSMAKKGKKSRDTRKVEISRVLYFWGGRTDLTMTQIAFWLQMRPSTHLMGILKEMQRSGLLKAKKERYRSNSDRFIWTLTADGERTAKFFSEDRRFGL